MISRIVPLHGPDVGSAAVSPPSLFTDSEA